MEVAGRRIGIEEKGGRESVGRGVGKGDATTMKMAGVRGGVRKGRTGIEMIIDVGNAITRVHALHDVIESLVVIVDGTEKTSTDADIGLAQGPTMIQWTTIINHGDAIATLDERRAVTAV